VTAAIDYYVLDTLANDIESFDDIVRLLNHPEIGWRQENHDREFAPAEVTAALARAIKEGCVRALVVDADHTTLQALEDFALPASPFQDCYYMLTPRGSLIHSNWQPPTDSA